MYQSNYSFKKISDKHGVVTYYTKPTKGIKYTNNNQILEHYNTAFASIGDKKWIWIFDSEGFSLSLVLDSQPGTGIVGIANLLMGKYGDSLLEIKIINPTWHIRTLLTAMWPFLNKQLKQKIKILDDRVYSIIEFV
jgi:hypothetical protein